LLYHVWTTLFNCRLSCCFSGQFLYGMFCNVYAHDFVRMCSLTASKDDRWRCTEGTNELDMTFNAKMSSVRVREWHKLTVSCTRWCGHDVDLSVIDKVHMTYCVLSQFKMNVSQPTASFYKSRIHNIKDTLILFCYVYT